MITKLEPRTDLKCMVCETPVPWNPNLKNWHQHGMGDQDPEGWGVFIERLPSAEEGSIHVTAYLCPGHANVMKVHADYIRRLTGLPVPERK